MLYQVVLLAESLSFFVAGFEEVSLPWILRQQGNEFYWYMREPGSGSFLSEASDENSALVETLIAAL